MVAEKFDEEALLKVIHAFELSEKITKLTWNWNNYSDSVSQAHELLNEGQKLFVEIAEYGQRMGSNLSESQKNKIDEAIEDLGKLIPYVKNKIKPSDILKNKSE